MTPFAHEFEIPFLPKMANTILRQHYWMVKKEKDKWMAAVFHGLGGKRPAEPLTKALITFTRFSSRKPDRDGMISGFKFIQDAIVKCGVITDDCDDVIDVHYAWEYASPKKGKVRIKIESVEETSNAGVS